MKPITAEWVGKAEGDFATVEREARARKNPNYDGVCFHAQQCAEKYLKALAVELDLPFLRTHDLVILLEQLLPVYPLWEVVSRRSGVPFGICRELPLPRRVGRP